MTNVNRSRLPLFERQIFQVMELQKYFTPNLELKVSKLAEPSLISIS